MDDTTNKVRPDLSKAWDYFYTELSGESERAAAIIGALMLDNALGNLIARFSANDKSEKKIERAYCSNLITESEKRDLISITNVRNIFAHELFTSFSGNQSVKISFDDQRVRKLCEGLEISKRFASSNPTARGYFQTAVGALIYIFTNRNTKVTAEVKTARELLAEQLDDPLYTRFGDRPNLP